MTTHELFTDIITDTDTSQRTMDSISFVIVAHQDLYLTDNVTVYYFVRATFMTAVWPSERRSQSLVATSGDVSSQGICM